MGLLQDGKWVDQWYSTESTGGHFVRKPPQFRNWITADGSPGPSGKGGFQDEDYPSLSGYVRDLFQPPGVAGSVHMRHIKDHYYQSHETINPTRIVPTGPDVDYTAPHARDRAYAS
jgi:glutathionyl-hydroquinone reductase